MDALFPHLSLVGCDVSREFFLRSWVSYRTRWSIVLYCAVMGAGPFGRFWTERLQSFRSLLHSTDGRILTTRIRS